MIVKNMTSDRSGKPIANQFIITIDNSKGNIIYPNFIKKLDGLGMKRGNSVGNLFIKFSINFPKTFTDEQIESLKNIL